MASILATQYDDRRQRGISPARSCTLEPDTDNLNQDCFEVGQVIEVKDTLIGQYPVNFIKITGISLQCRTYEGIPFIRTRSMKGRLPKKYNETCMMLQIRQQDPELVVVKAHLVVRRRKMIMTNSVYPEFAVRGNAQPSTDFVPGEFTQPNEDTTLVCRWKWTTTFSRNQRQSKIKEEAIERIYAEEASGPQFMLSENILCDRWRGGRTRGGAWPSDQGQFVIECEDGCSVESQPFRRRGQKFTLFDSFAGARGVSRGAQSAGFRVSHAVDRDPAVWDTYSINFPETVLYRMSVDQFIQETKDVYLRPDVLHMSPPCQFFSPAHTQSGAHDEENTDAILSSHALVHKLRPRLITLEETFGLQFEQHQDYFNSLIGDLTHHGYSVRWKVVELCTWGSAQTRKRLIIIAAGPGERLPPFPPPTHSKDLADSLPPYNTIRRALSKIQPGDDLHDLASVTHFSPPRPSLNPDTQIGTILTSPGGMYYPDGNRNYTLREYACLQGFPLSHQFLGTKTSIRRQIGNAFPPNTVKHLYQHLERWLLKEDEIREYRPPSTEIVTLD
uniref:DNA (cytosine-5-)-methyltransferase n=1 Tax=Claviceps paspali TaxID=40601 RepID=M1Q0D9_CLAPA|nr:DmtA [Claviceps paspali]